MKREEHADNHELSAAFKKILKQTFISENEEKIEEQANNMERYNEIKNMLKQAFIDCYPDIKYHEIDSEGRYYATPKEWRNEMIKRDFEDANLEYVGNGLWQLHYEVPSAETKTGLPASIDIDYEIDYQEGEIIDDSINNYNIKEN